MEFVTSCLLVPDAIVALFVRLRYLLLVMYKFRVLHPHRPDESLESDVVVLVYNVTSHLLITISSGTYSK